MRIAVAQLLAALALAITTTEGHAAQESTGTTADTYTVQPGDTLSGISTRTGVPLELLVEINHLDDPNRISAGTVLRLRPETPFQDATRGQPGNGERTVAAPGVPVPAFPPPRPPTASPTQATGAPMRPASRAVLAPPPAAAAEPASASQPAAGSLTAGGPAPQRQTSSITATSASVPGARPPSAAPALSGAPALRAPGLAVAQIALEYNGAPYLYGGDSPDGFDCSGFVQFVQRRAGRWIPRDLAGQYAAGPHPDALEPGDLVFFQDTYDAGLSHVGIYIGDGRFIHAIDEIRGVGISSLSDPYYVERWYGATRIP